MDFTNDTVDIDDDYDAGLRPYDVDDDNDGVWDYFEVDTDDDPDNDDGPTQLGTFGGNELRTTTTTATMLTLTRTGWYQTSGDRGIMSQGPVSPPTMTLTTTTTVCRRRRP